MRKSKALDWLLHHVEIVDESGQPIDRELLLGHDHDHDDHAGHDHAGHDHAELDDRAGDEHEHDDHDHDHDHAEEA